MQTEIPDPEETKENQVLSQFVHLTIQEFLAMVGLLKESPHQVSNTLREFSKTEQFNMALLFLYGFAFNTDNETIKAISSAVGGLSDQKEEIQKVLLQAVGVSSNIDVYWITLIFSLS